MAARSGMAGIIEQVRQLAAASEDEYSIGYLSYWDDEQIQTHLDRVRVEFWDEPVQAVPTVNSGGTTEYKEYRLPRAWWEQTTGGTAVFYLRDSTGARIGTANYTMDFQYGRLTFGADQAGSVRYVTGRSYDVYEAAARVWEAKAAHVAQKFDFSADGASYKASNQYKQYMEMARAMRSQSNSGGVSTARLGRNDVNESEWPESSVRATRVDF